MEQAKYSSVVRGGGRVGSKNVFENALCVCKLGRGAVVQFGGLEKKKTCVG